MNGKIRIKDKMRSAYTPVQWLGAQIEAIGESRLADPVAIAGWEIREAVYLGPGRYEWLDRKWRKFRIGDVWGGENRTGFFRCEVKAPAGYRGKSCVVKLIPGGEGLLHLNGKPLAGLDIKHDTVFVGDRMKGGETLRFEIEQNAIQMEVYEYRHKFETALIAVLDREAEEAYFDFKCAYDVMVSDRAAREVRDYLFSELKSAMKLIDFHAADGKAFGKSLGNARAALRKSVYECGRFKEEGRLNMVGHSHLDLVYQWGYREFLRKIGRTHSTALNVMREFPDYLFCQSQMKLYEDLKRLYPDIYSRIKRRVKEGRWEVVGGMYVEPDCNLISGESLIRQILYGKKFMKDEFGADSAVCWLPDVFGNSWIMPQILQKCGMRFFITNKIVIWNDTNEFPHNTFWWEGPDGSRVLAHMPATHFGATVNGDVMLTNWDEYKQKVECGEAMYNYGYGDGRGGPTRDDVLSGRRFGNMPGVSHAEFAHAQTHFERAEAAIANPLPVWKDELYLETHRGTYTTQAILKKNNRKSEILYRNVEALSAVAELLGGRYPKEELDEGRKIILKNQFHDILPGSHVTEARDDAVEEYRTVFRNGAVAKAEAVGFIAKRIGAGDADGRTVAVFNTATWERMGAVEAEFKAPAGKFHLEDTEGSEVAHQALGRGGGTVRVLFNACGVPSMGYRIFRLVPGAPVVKAALAATEKGMENEFFRIRFAGDGTLAGIFDKKRRREVLKLGGRGNRFQIFEDVPGRYPAWDIVPMYKDMEFDMAPSARTRVAETGPVRAVVVQERRFMKSKMVQRIAIYRDVPRIDFETEIEWRERDRLLKVGFDADVSAMKAAYDISCGYIERPTHRNTSWDAAKFEVCAHQWADISEGDYGVSLLNDCKYGHDVEGGRMRLTLLKGSRSPDPAADLGHHEFTYSLYPHAGDWRAAETPRRAWELNDPLFAATVPDRAGALGTGNSFVSIDKDNVVMMALKKAEDGDGYILRLCEIQNRRGTVNVKFFVPISGAAECDAIENETGKARLSGGALRLDIKPYEIRTFRLRFKGSGRRGK
jgi:alpha-mannosidase